MNNSTSTTSTIQIRSKTETKQHNKITILLIPDRKANVDTEPQ